MTAEQMQKFNPDVFGLMQSKLARNHKGLNAFLGQKQNATSQIYDFNTSNEVQHIESESIDIVVTSPPYGDSRTTVAYGQFSRLANEWLDVENANQIDNDLMGGKDKKKFVILTVWHLKKALKKLHRQTKKEPKKFLRFIATIKSLLKT
jgi:site-specific DNA-methyltransferase (cytosine-N4-specific)